MKTYIKLLIVALMPYIFMACKKDITPTKSDLMIKSIDYSFGGQNSLNHSNYDFEYSENNILLKINLEGILSYENRGLGMSPFVFTTKYNGNIFDLDKNIGQGENGLNYNGEDQSLIIENNGKIKTSILRTGYHDAEFGVIIGAFESNFYYLNGMTNSIKYNNEILRTDFAFTNDKLITFLSNKQSRFGGSDSTITYNLFYQTTTPDTSVIKVNGINNLILCIPFEVQETLPFLVVDDRLSLTGVKQKHLINSITVVEKRDNVIQKTTTYTINYLYDLEGRITHVQWINNATLAIYREAVIGYL